MNRHSVGTGADCRVLNSSSSAAFVFSGDNVVFYKPHCSSGDIKKCMRRTRVCALLPEETANLQFPLLCFVGSQSDELFPALCTGGDTEE